MTTRVVIVGAGMAAATAATRLAPHGIEVVVLEASPRVGGRAHSIAVPGWGAPVDLGGGWIRRDHHRVRRLGEELGISWSPAPTVVGTRYHTAGALRLGAPVPADEAGVAEAIVADLRSRRRDLSRVDPTTSLTAHLDALAAGPGVRDLVHGWWALSGGGDPDRGALVALLDALEDDDDPFGSYVARLALVATEGMATLVERALVASGADVRLGTRVVAVEPGPAAVTVRTAGGDLLEAAACICTVALNALGAVALPLPAGIPAAPRHAGAVHKAWFELEGVGPGHMAVGDAGALQWAMTTRATGRGSIGVGLGRSPGAGHPLDLGGAVARFFPDGRLVAAVLHDWERDPWAQGGWACPTVSAPDLLDPARWRPDGRLVFASSDTAPAWGSWFEGAALAGDAAVDHLLERRYV